MSNEKPDLIERDAVLRVFRAHNYVPGHPLLDDVNAIPAATVSGTKPSIDWSHVAPEFVALARNPSGLAWFHRSNPKRGSGGWDSNTYVQASSHASYTPGTCDWRDSLVMRPGYKGE